MNYYLKDNVTNEMLEAVGFIKYKEIPFPIYTRNTGVYCDMQKENETLIIFRGGAWCVDEIMFNGNWLDLDIEDYIQDLIQLGYVEVRKWHHSTFQCL